MRNYVLLCILLCFFEAAFSQQVFEINLAENPPEMVHTFPSAPTTIKQFKLINCLPGKPYRYTITVQKKIMENKPLTTAEFSGLGGNLESAKSALLNDSLNNTDEVRKLLEICNQLIEPLNKLSNSKKLDETLIPKMKSEVEAAYNKFTTKKAEIDSLYKIISNQIVKTFIDNGLKAYEREPKIIKRTEMTSTPTLPIVVEANEMLIVAINRYYKDPVTEIESVQKKWKIEIKGAEPSRWKLYYGFTYAPNGWNNFKDYYLKSTEISNVTYSKDSLGNIIDSTVTTQTKYAVTEKHNQKTKFLTDFTPTILFTYSIAKTEFFGIGVAGALSTNFSSNTAVFLGLSGIIGDNVNLNLGYGAIKKEVLKGEYEEGQLLNDNNATLKEAQWMWGFTISLGFRFDKNPYKSSGSSNQNTTPAENTSENTNSEVGNNSNNNSVNQPNNSNPANNNDPPAFNNDNENNNDGTNTGDDPFGPHI